jgi:predicted dehydrogenase
MAVRIAAQMQEFANAISEKREPIVKYSQMLTQLAIIDAARESATIHQPITLKI